MARLTQRIVRRFGKSAPGDLQALARAVRASRRGSVIVEIPYADSAVVVGAHPDDETAMAGGTIALLTSQGTRVSVVIATAGEGSKGSDEGIERIREKRVAEVGTACQILGAREPLILGYPDGSVLDHTSDLAAELSDIIARERPQLLFAPWWLDDHPDHRAVAAAIVEADMPESISIWLGEIWTPLAPNRIVDITSSVDQKRQALTAHATAARAFDLDAFLGLNRYRSVRGMRGVGYAEAFLVTTPSALRAIVETPHVR